jgi:UDP-GlcNAc:undecaprenyl-phosphate GlcNAc-1-phosphate transferase
VSAAPKGPGRIPVRDTASVGAPGPGPANAVVRDSASAIVPVVRDSASVVRDSAPVAAVLGAGLGRVAWQVLRGLPPGGAQRWERKNHRGEPVTLLEGPALAGATAAAIAAVPRMPARVRAAGLIAVTGAGLMGTVDDLAERGGSKGLRGHLGALARGRLTTGGLKILGIGVTGLLAAAVVLPGQGERGSGADASDKCCSDGCCSGSGCSRGCNRGTPRPGRSARAVAGRAFDVATGGALVAGSANLVNLLDLRPGRALKVVLAAAPLLAGRRGGALAATTAGAAVALLREDLGEQAMLGDTGANAAGAVLGAALVASAGRRTRLAALAAVVGLTLASERWSFTTVIESTPVLRQLDALGRRPR